MEYKWADAQKNGKPEVVARLLADRFVNTDTDARITGKDTVLANRGSRTELAT